MGEEQHSSKLSLETRKKNDSRLVKQEICLTEQKL